MKPNEEDAGIGCMFSGPLLAGGCLVASNWISWTLALGITALIAPFVFLGVTRLAQNHRIRKFRKGL